MQPRTPELLLRQGTCLVQEVVQGRLLFKTPGGSMRCPGTQTFLDPPLLGVPPRAGTNRVFHQCLYPPCLTTTKVAVQPGVGPKSAVRPGVGR